MINREVEISEFIQANKRVSYFDYLRSNHGIDPEKREDKINNLVIYLLRGYIYIYSISFCELDEKQTLIFKVIEAIIAKETTEKLKVEEIKKVLFMRDKNIYQATIEVMESIKTYMEVLMQDFYLPKLVDIVIEQKELESLAKSALLCLEYIKNEKNLGEARKKAIA